MTGSRRMWIRQECNGAIKGLGETGWKDTESLWQAGEEPVFGH